MSCGVGRLGQLQTGTCHWKIRRIFQVGEDKPLLIHIVCAQYGHLYLTAKLDINLEGASPLCAGVTSGSISKSQGC